MVCNELQIKSMKGLMGATIKGFLPGNFLICLVQWKRENFNSIEHNHCIYDIKMFLDLALNKIPMWLWATLFCMPDIMFLSEGNDHFSPGFNGQLKGCNEKMFFQKPNNKSIE